MKTTKPQIGARIRVKEAAGLPFTECKLLCESSSNKGIWYVLPPNSRVLHTYWVKESEFEIIEPENTSRNVKPEIGARIRSTSVCRPNYPYFSVGDKGTLTRQDKYGDWWADMDKKYCNGHWCISDNGDAFEIIEPADADHSIVA